MDRYTFEEWVNGIDEPSNPFWYVENTKGVIHFNKSRDEIVKARRNTFYHLVQMHYEWFWPLIENSFPKEMDIDERSYMANQELSRQQEKIEGFGLEKILRGPTDDELDFIDGGMYRWVKNTIQNNANGSQEKIEFNGQRWTVGKGIVALDNIVLEAHVAYKISKSLKEWIDEHSLPEDIQEKLDSLQQKLCILYDLGILDLLDERFKPKNCIARGPETEKAKLLDLILGIGYHKNVRSELSKKGYLSKKAIKEAIEILKKHGLTNQKLIDPDTI